MKWQNLAQIPCVVISLLVLLAQTGITQEITVGNDYGVGARALGMGGAFLGVADDYTATYWNPAGLAQITKNEVFTTLMSYRLESTSTYYQQSQSALSSATHPNSVGFVLPFPTARGRLVFAFGVNRIQNFDSRVLIEGFEPDFFDEELGQISLDLTETSRDSGGIYAWTASGALALSPRLALGASLNYWRGSNAYQLDLLGEDTQNLDTDIASLTYFDTIDAEYRGITGKLGGLFHPTKYVRIGATIDLPMSLNVDEDWTQTGEDFYDDGTSNPYETFGVTTYDISRPFQFGSGIALTLKPLLLAFDVQYTDWPQSRYSSPPAEDVNVDTFLEDYRATWRVRVGGEYHMPKVPLLIRAGYRREPVPYAPDHLRITDARDFVTLGLGGILDGVFVWDIAYMRGLWGHADDNLELDWRSNHVLFSAGYRFP